MENKKIYTESKKAYNEQEVNFAIIPEVTAAEEAFHELFDQLHDINPDLANEIDSAAGKLARAYSLMGFIGAAQARAKAGVA